MIEVIAEEIAGRHVHQSPAQVEVLRLCAFTPAGRAEKDEMHGR